MILWVGWIANSLTLAFFSFFSFSLPAKLAVEFNKLRLFNAAVKLPANETEALLFSRWPLRR